MFSGILLLFSALIPLCFGTVWPKILLLGDNYVANCYYDTWCAELANRYVRVADVRNRGAYNYNTQSYLAVLEDCFSGTDTNNIGVVLLFIGTTDSVKNSLGIPIKDYKSNLDAILKNITQKLSPKQIILVGPTPPNLKTSVLRPREHVDGYDKMSKQLASSNKITSYLSIYTTWSPAQSETWFDGNGMFNTAGSKAFLDLIAKPIYDKLKEFMGPSFMKKKFPTIPKV